MQKWLRSEYGLDLLKRTDFTAHNRGCRQGKLQLSSYFNEANYWSVYIIVVQSESDESLSSVLMVGVGA